MNLKIRLSLLLFVLLKNVLTVLKSEETTRKANKTDAFIPATSPHSRLSTVYLHQGHSGMEFRGSKESE